jgi:hypothetical protein
MKNKIPEVRVGDYPELRLITWTYNENVCLPENEIFALYEANWHLIHKDQITEKEWIFINYLKETYGRGYMHV